MDKLYEVEGFSQEDIDRFNEVWNSIKEAVSQTVEKMAEVIQKIAGSISEYEFKKSHYYNWHVPMDMTKPPQIPKMPNVAMPRIRNSI